MLSFDEITHDPFSIERKRTLILTITNKKIVSKQARFEQPAKNSKKQTVCFENKKATNRQQTSFVIRQKKSKKSETIRC